MTRSRSCTAIVLAIVLAILGLLFTLIGPSVGAVNIAKMPVRNGAGPPPPRT